MLINVINNINTELKALQPLVQVENVYGNRAVPFNAVTPRVVWTFTGDTYTPTRHLGTNPHQVKSLQAGIDAHIFHKTPDELYYLINDVFVAVHRTVLEPSVISCSGVWLDPGENTQNGYGYRMSLVLDITIVEPPRQEVTITTAEPTVTITFT